MDNAQHRLYQYQIKITNGLEDEFLSPIVVTGTSNDRHYFDGDYMTPEGEAQILSGMPDEIVARIGKDKTSVGQGTDGPPGTGLGPGKSVTFTFETGETVLRILSMVSPFIVPDHYVTAVVDMRARQVITATLERFTIGHDNGTHMIAYIGDSGSSVEITRIK